MYTRLYSFQSIVCISYNRNAIQHACHLKSTNLFCIVSFHSSNSIISFSFSSTFSCHSSIFFVSSEQQWQRRSDCIKFELFPTLGTRNPQLRKVPLTCQNVWMYTGMYVTYTAIRYGSMGRRIDGAACTISTVEVKFVVFLESKRK